MVLSITIIIYINRHVLLQKTNIIKNKSDDVYLHNNHLRVYVYGVRIPEGSFAANPTVVLSATSMLPMFLCSLVSEAKK